MCGRGIIRNNPLAPFAKGNYPLEGKRWYSEVIALRSIILILALLIIFVTGSHTHAQLNENCTVSILNRTVVSKPDGTWVLPNVPANLGQVRARATCVENGMTRSGQSDFFTIPANGSITLPPIPLDVVEPIPLSLTIVAATTTLTSVGATTELTVTGIYPDGGTRNLTAAGTGTNYSSTNSNIATVSAEGLVTARSSGTVAISAINEGALGMIRIQVTLSADTDGDGIPDDIELANGLNPNNPVDGMEDADHDGLTNAEEITLGTNMRNSDTDGDGLTDSNERALGTRPLLADSDGDGIHDRLEV